MYLGRQRLGASVLAFAIAWQMRAAYRAAWCPVHPVRSMAEYACLQCRGHGGAGVARTWSELRCFELCCFELWLVWLKALCLLYYSLCSFDLCDNF